MSDPMKKVVLDVKLSGNNKKKRKALKALAELDWIFTLSVEMIDDQKLMAIGNIEAAQLVKKLEKICEPKIHSLGPAAEGQQQNGAPSRDNNKTKKVVLMAELSKKENKKKAMKAVAEFDGLISMTVDKNRNKLTVIGNIDAYKVEKKLNKICDAKLETVDPPGPAK